MILIDPPSHFAPDQEWKDFLEEMESLDASGEDRKVVDEHIAIARERLA